MKKSLFGIFLLTSISLFAQVEFSIKVTNKPSDSLTIRNQTQSQLIVSDKKGEFKSNFNVTEGFYQLKIGEQYTNLYLKNGYNLAATVDYSKFDETLKYTGKGAKENNFLAKQLVEASKVQNDPFEEAKKATTETQLNDAISKIKASKLSNIPTDLDAVFTTTFKKSIEDELNYVGEYFKKSLSLNKLNGSISPSFDYENHKGGKTKLEDFRGKYVYIDVWATWCGPCRAEIPHLKKTEETFHGKNIEFVSLSIDAAKDHDKWKKFVDEKQLGGVQIMADKDWNSEFAIAYGIQSIPRFILIGPDGKVVSANAPRPSSPELATLLNSVVK